MGVKGFNSRNQLKCNSLCKLHLLGKHTVVLRHVNRTHTKEYTLNILIVTVKEVKQNGRDENNLSP